MNINLQLSSEFLEEFDIELNQLSSDIVLNFQDMQNLLSFYNEFINLNEDIMENIFVTRIHKIGNVIAGYCHRLNNYKYECKLLTNRLNIYTLFVTFRYGKIKKLNGNIVEMMNVFKDKFINIIKNIEAIIAEDVN
jgi:hypothetical protein